MEIAYFVGAFILLITLIYATLDRHYRSKHTQHEADQIVRDRYHNNQT